MHDLPAQVILNMVAPKLSVQIFLICHFQVFEVVKSQLQEFLIPLTGHVTTLLVKIIAYTLDFM